MASNLTLTGVGSLLVAWLSIATAYAQRSPMQPAIFAPAARPVEVFAGGNGKVFEGPAMAPDGRVFFTDFPSDNSGGLIWSYNPSTGQAEVLRAPSSIAIGLVFDAAGRLVVAEGPNGGGKRITRLDIRTGQRTVLADSFGGRPFNGPNDLTLDAQGRVYFTDSRYLSTEPLDQPWMGVYRLETNGTVQLLAADLTRPNGLAFSPDQRTLYVGSYDAPGVGIYGALPPDYAGPKPRSGGVLVAYDVQPNGQLTFRKRLAQFEGEGPDGLTVDAAGHLYAAVANRLVVYSPQGEQLAEMALPPEAEKTSNLCFGHGKYRHTLFITAAKRLYTLQTTQTRVEAP